jgi:hypothetical protein
VHGEPAAPESGIVDDVVVNQGGRVDELDHRRVQHGPIAGIPAQSRRHQQDGWPNPLSTARLDVLANNGNQLDLRLDVTRKLRVDPGQVFTDGLENLGEDG